jgi:endonuclease/exonuclease/phosphatase (EEP) superfamily protein YafD
MPVDSAIYRRYWSAWQNAFSTAGLGFGYTKYTRRWGIRIDHVLAGDEWRVLEARVGPDLGGDHRPVVVKLELK